MGWREDVEADGITYLNCGDTAVLDEAEEEARARIREAKRNARMEALEWVLSRRLGEAARADVRYGLNHVRDYGTLPGTPSEVTA